MPQKYKRRFGDRYDGRKVRHIDPFFKIIPHIMTQKCSSNVLLEEQIDLEPVEEYLKQLRREGRRDIRTLHVIIAAFVRTISQRPHINRFVSGRRLFAHNSIRISLAIKRGMTRDAEETTLKIEFQPEDTIFDVADRINAEYNKNSSAGDKNGTDKTAKIITMIPNFLIRFIVFIIKRLDNFGLMPKFFNKVSPFHCSAFLTDIGSLGLGSVYHHLYEFGTCSVFIGIGKKESKIDKLSDGSIGEKKYIALRFVIDERICDGFYNASTIKHIRRMLRKPETMNKPPEEIPVDLTL